MSAEHLLGTILAGKYRVERVLGQGGMGMVVAAQHIHLEEKVAIKFLLPEMLQERELVERFSREARAVVKIKSEYVARVTDVGNLETGAPYMVMEYLEGEDLSERLKREGALPAMQAVEFVLQACEALAEAHALGIIHRDIKPANLFCVRRADGLLAAKLLDFGISKAGAGVDLRMTKTSTILGSPYYMSPEQMVSAKNADAQSDIWSLGVVLFELLSGFLPFQGQTFPELILTITGTAAPDVNAMATDVPEGLKRVVLRCLERDRSRRYATVSQLAGALAPFGPKDRAQASADRVLRIAIATGEPSLAPQTERLSQTAPAGSQPDVLESTEVGQQNLGAATLVGGETLIPLGRTSSGVSWLPQRKAGRLWLGVAVVGLGGFAAALVIGSAEDDAPVDPAASAKPPVIVSEPVKSVANETPPASAPPPFVPPPAEPTAVAEQPAVHRPGQPTPAQLAPTKKTASSTKPTKQAASSTKPTAVGAAPPPAPSPKSASTPATAAAPPTGKAFLGGRL